MKLKLLFALLIVQIGFAQQRKCGTEEYMERVMANPVLKQQYLESQARFEAEMLRINQQGRNTALPNSPNATIRIPVAVHFPSAGSASAAIKTCLRRLAQKQVDILNADYNATNTDVGLWTAASVFYPGTTIGSMAVSFELATQNHPAGTGLATGETAVTFGTDFLSGADSDPTWAGYCNLVVRVIGNQTLGYSPLGGYPMNGATVVIDSNAFGASMTPTPATCTGYVPGYPYNLGRTLTHELGHFFNLRHTFDGCDGTNCLTSGDRVCDTPEANDPEYNCLAAGTRASGCGGTQLTMNYMDYVQDRCMYMFTAGQATRMMAWYDFIDDQFLTNVLGNNEFVTRNFSIAPNPNNGTFAIQLKEQTEQFSVLIIDSLGRIVYDNEFNQTTDLVQTIQLNNALSGVYFVTIGSNGETLTKKVIVE
jgi:hypothetical protein